MNKRTKIVAFDVGTERPTEEYVTQLEEENKKIADAAERGIGKAWKRVEQLEAELKKIVCHWCEEGVTEAKANKHYKSCAKNPLRAENKALRRYARHRDGCKQHIDDKDCVCGYSALLTGGE